MVSSKKKQDEVKQLRKALKPFAEAGQVVMNHVLDSYKGPLELKVPADHLRTAAKTYGSLTPKIVGSKIIGKDCVLDLTERKLEVAMKALDKLKYIYDSGVAFDALTAIEKMK